MLSGKRLLFVDDERSIRETLSIILWRYGFTVTLAATVEQALEQIRTWEFDLLLCDYSLEQEHTGFEVIDYGRKKQANTKAAILTGYASKETAEQARQNGIAILYKPIDIEEFFTTIDKLLREEYEPLENSEEEGGHNPRAAQEGSDEEGSTQPGTGRHSRSRAI